MQLKVAEVQHRCIEMKAYEIGFEECKALAKQILPSIEVRLLQILMLAISHISWPSSRLTEVCAKAEDHSFFFFIHVAIAFF